MHTQPKGIFRWKTKIAQQFFSTNFLNSLAPRVARSSRGLWNLRQKTKKRQHRASCFLLNKPPLARSIPFYTKLTKLGTWLKSISFKYNQVSKNFALNLLGIDFTVQIWITFHAYLSGEFAFNLAHRLLSFWALVGPNKCILRIFEAAGERLTSHITRVLLHSVSSTLLLILDLARPANKSRSYPPPI